jgi:hypothetical protein
MALPLLAQALLAGPVFPVETSASFTGGIYGTWDFTFDSGPAGLYLQQIVIDLSPANLGFDTVPGGFGSLTSLDVGGYSGTDVTTGLSGILPGTGAALDGGQILIFQFTDFTAGETFHFTADVDSPNPTLLPIRDCSGLGPIARAICLAQNAANTVINDARLAAASVVTAQQFAGTRVTYTLGGPGYVTTEITSVFEPAGGLRVFGSTSGTFDEVMATPEPATPALLGAGALLLGIRRLRRRA